MKCDQSRPGFELVSLCPFPTTIHHGHLPKSNPHIDASTLSSILVSPFLPSFLPSFLRSFLRSFHPSFHPSFLRSFLRSFLPSFLPSLLPSFLRSFLPSFLDLYSLSTLSLGCMALCIVISFFYLLIPLLKIFFVHFKNGPEYFTRRIAHVFIPLIRFLLYSLVSVSVLILLRYYYYYL